MAESQKGIEDHKKAEDEWAVQTGHVKDKIEEIRQKMIAAKDTTHDFHEAIRDESEAHKEAGEAAAKHGIAEEKTAAFIKESEEGLRKYRDAWRELNSIG